MSDLRFGVLGPLEVVRGERPVPVPTGRRRAVLACLLVHVGRPVPADTLIEAAWRDDLPDDPRAALHTVLSRLRTRLGADVLVSDAAGYALAVDAASVDAHRFDELRERARSAPPAQAARLLGDALALWRGRAYDEYADHDFAAPEAGRLERARQDAVEQHAALAIDVGEHEAAAEELETLLAEHPFLERAVELLMTALYRAGRQADALARYRTHRELLAEELGLDPAPALRDLEARILGHDVPAAGRREAVEAPAWLDTSTAFFGRDATLADLVEAVAGDRLVTVTGVGGVGKTRLVAEALPALAERLQRPITVVELASVQPELVSTAVADALGLSPRAGAVTDDVLEYLSIAQVVLVLDNCEHVLAPVAELAEAVGRRCPRVRLLATSRHRLGTTAERVVPLVPLPTLEGSPDRREIEATPAVRLFTDRVRRLRPAFALTAENTRPVHDLCRHLDGLPLALELAASRAATLGVEPVLLRFGAEPADVSLRDLRGMVEWSARLLTAEQRRLLGHLAVFAGDFGAEDVRGLGDRLGPWSERGGLLGAFEELVESSLLSSHERGGEVRHRMLALVRSYAAEELTRSGEEGAARLAHARWVRALVERAARQWVSGEAAEASARLAWIRSDLNAALRWALDDGRLDLAAATTGAVRLCLHWLPGVELGELMLEVAERCAAAQPDPELALGMAAGAMVAAERGDLPRTRHLAGSALASSATELPRLLACLALAVSTFYAGEHDEAAAWLDRIDDLPDLAPGHRVEPLITRALLACYHGDLDTARASVSAALVGAEAVPAEAARAFALYAAGEIEARRDPDAGAARFREAAEEALRIGCEHVGQVSRLALFAVLVRRGRDDEALDVAVPLLHDVRRAGAWPQVWTTLRIAAELLATSGRREDAALLLAAADAEASAPPLVGEDVSRYALLSEDLRCHLGATVVERISDLASGISRAQVVDRAVAVLGALSR